MHTFTLIYIFFLFLQLIDIIYVIYNFKYSYFMNNKEREATNQDIDASERRSINYSIIDEYGLIRAFIRTIGYYFWFVAGFFTPFWGFHVGLLAFNYLHEFFNGGQIKISEFSFGFKVVMYLLLYLLIIQSFIMMK